jgi:hypothetical protein
MCDGDVLRLCGLLLEEIREGRGECLEVGGVDGRG